MTLCLYLSPGGFPVLERRGAPVPLRPKEAAVLGALASTPDDFWNREMLEDHVWGGPDRSPECAFSRLNFHVSRLRSKAGFDLIETGVPRVRGAEGPDGWRLGPAVRVFTILGEVARAPGAFPAGVAA